MKDCFKTLVFYMLACVVSLSLLSCDMSVVQGKDVCTDHTDANADGVCDICGEAAEGEAPEEGETSPTPDVTDPAPDVTDPAPDITDPAPDDTTSEQDPAPDEEAEYTLTFISQGTVIETVKIKRGESFEPPTPSRGSEYILLGWKNVSSGEKITDSIFNWSEDTTLTAIWDTVWSEGF